MAEWRGDAITVDGAERMSIHERHKAWIMARNLDPTLAEKFGIATTQDGNGFWLTVPYVERGRTINHKYRQTSEKRHRMDTDAPLALWNHDVLLAPEVQNGAAVIITEGEWDALAAIQSGFPLAMSVPNGAPPSEADNPFEARRYEFIQRSRDLIDKVQSFILATDADEPGRALAADLARLLGPERCRFVRYPEGSKDLNDVLITHGHAAMVELINGAKPYPVKGLYRFEDFPEPPPIQSLAIGIDGLDDLFKLVPGTFTVITGYAGQGKSSWLLAALAKLLKKGVPIALASFETMVKPILQRRLRAAMYGLAEFKPECLSYGPADEVMEQKFGIIAQTADDEDTEMDLDYLLELAKVAVLRDGIRLLVIDPWNEIEHKRRSDESETDYTGRAIRSLKRFAKLYECAVWLVAHPRKPQMDGRLRKPSLYDLAGSANFANKADYGVVIHREDLTSTLVDVKVAKVRMGLPGKMGQVTLNWNPDTSGYEQWAA
jgi:twinkle protein